MIMRCERCGNEYDNHGFHANESVCYPCRDKELNEVLEKFRQQKIQRQIEYGDYLKSDHWKATRKLALQHANYQCQKCGSKSDLNVHHKNYRRKGHEHLEDLEVLCYQCHMKTHAIAKWVKESADY